MLKQVVAVAALFVLPLGYGLTLCAAPAVSSSPSIAGSPLPARLLGLPSPPSRVALPQQAVSPRLTPVTQRRPPVSRTFDPEGPLHEQMHVLERVARKDMLLYTGHFTPAYHASSQQLPVVALTLSGVAMPR